MSSDLPYWVAFAHHPKIGAMTFQKLIKRFPRLGLAWAASRTTLIRAGLEPNIVEAILDARRTIDPETALRQLRRADVGIITLVDANYPRLLKELPDPPAVLFVRGSLSAIDGPTLAVVGSRKYTPYGKRVTETIVPELVAAGCTVVSGLALGIDVIAHLATLTAGGQTAAVLGSGIDSIYPHSHQQVADRIVRSGGVILSEFPPGTPSYPSNFPIRNRIIAGLALGTIIIEAAIDSGSLLTARAALEYNREVFAVPGDIFRDTSQGTNNLIAMGAKVVREAQDILTELAIGERRQKSKARKIIPETPEEGSLLVHLSTDPVHIDQLVKASKMEVQKVGATLILLEMKGRVRNVGGNQYVKIE